MTTQQRDQQRLRKLQRWLQATQRDPKVGLFERNYDTDAAVWDPRMRAIWGLPDDATAPGLAAFRSFIVPGDLKLTDDTRARALAGPGFHEAEYRIRNARGEERWVKSYWAVDIDERGHRVAIGSARDITDAVQARLDAEAERTQLLMAAELARVGLLRHDLQSGRFHANAAARQILGLPVEGELDQRMMIVDRCVHPEDRDAVRSAWARLLADDALDPEIRYRVLRDDGEVVHVLSRRRLMRGADGEPHDVIGAVFDITQQVHAVESARRSRELEADRAASLAQARTALLAAVSHGVRTPLNAMVVACEQLSGNASAVPAGLEVWLGVLNEACSHLQGLAEDLLRGVAQEHGATAEPAVGTQGDAAAAGVRLELDPSVQALCVHAPPRRLRQILLNLIGNAIKYNRRGGWVRGSARRLAPASVELRVEDGGIGMSPEQVERLFSPFDRLGREAGPVSGFRLGLHLVQRFVREMGGSVSVTSESGVGTCVTLLLPEGADGQPIVEGERSAWFPPGSVPPRPPQRPPARDALPVLCVDDDPLTPMLLTAQVAQAGTFDLTAADSLPSALAALASLKQRGRSPALAILDLHLGVHSGVQVLQALRAAGYAGPAVVFTGEADPAARPALLASGFADVWVKPMAAAGLRAGLQRVLGPLVTA